jgi:hypothetical protein
MKRDMDLVRAILFEVEKHDDWESEFEVCPEGNYTRQEIEYHITLCSEAGLIKAKRWSFQEGLQPSRLTWEGHEFLDAARDDNTWANAKEIMLQVGGFVFSAAQQVLIQLVTQKALELAGLKGPR